MSQEIYDRLVAAGAPELPEGYFYRITEHERFGGEYYVDIRKKKRFWSVSVLTWSVFHDGILVSISDIVNRGYSIDEAFALAAQNAYGEWRATSYTYDEWKKYREFEGDHP